MLRTCVLSHDGSEEDLIDTAYSVRPLGTDLSHLGPNRNKMAEIPQRHLRKYLIACTAISLRVQPRLLTMGRFQESIME